MVANNNRIVVIDIAYLSEFSLQSFYCTGVPEPIPNFISKCLPLHSLKYISNIR